MSRIEAAAVGELTRVVVDALHTSGLGHLYPAAERVEAVEPETVYA